MKNIIFITLVVGAFSMLFASAELNYQTADTMNSNHQTTVIDKQMTEEQDKKLTDEEMRSLIASIFIILLVLCFVVLIFAMNTIGINAVDILVIFIISYFVYEYSTAYQLTIFFVVTAILAVLSGWWMWFTAKRLNHAFHAGLNISYEWSGYKPDMDFDDINYKDDSLNEIEDCADK